MTSQDQRAETSRLWKLLPRYLRSRDRAPALKGLVQALGLGLDEARDDLLSLLDEAFIETCSPEQIALIADLVGVVVSVQQPISRQRYSVKNALRQRSIRGTPKHLTSLCWQATGGRTELIERLSAADQSALTAAVLGEDRSGSRMPYLSGGDLFLRINLPRPILRRQVRLRRITGSAVHAVDPEEPIGMRHQDGCAIRRCDAPSGLIGPGEAIEIVIEQGCRGAEVNLRPVFCSLQNIYRRIPEGMIAIDPELGRVSVSPRDIASPRFLVRFNQGRKVEMRYSKPAQVIEDIYSVHATGLSGPMFDEDGRLLSTPEADQPGHESGTRVKTTEGRSGLTSWTWSVTGAGTTGPRALETRELRRLVRFEGAEGAEVYSSIRLVHQLTQEALQTDTLELCVNEGLFRVGGRLPDDLRVGTLVLVDQDALLSQVDTLLRAAVPIGRRFEVSALDSAPGHDMGSQR